MDSIFNKKHKSSKEYLKNYLGHYSFPALKDDFKSTDTTTIYINNSFGFRTKEFKKFNNSNINILYSGCSYTYGQGLPEEYIWTTQLTNKIKENIKKEIVDYNIAYCGSSIHSIIRGIFSFINQYGNPDYLFIMFPTFSRDLYYAEEHKGFMNSLIYNGGSYSTTKSLHRYNEEFIPENKMFLSTTLLFMLEKYCEASGISLFWSTWNENDQLVYESLDFNNFIKTEGKDLDRPININNLPYWDYAEDGEHPGTYWSQYISDVFFKEMEKKNNEKNN